MELKPPKMLTLTPEQGWPQTGQNQAVLLCIGGNSSGPGQAP